MAYFTILIIHGERFLALRQYKEKFRYYWGILASYLQFFILFIGDRAFDKRYEKLWCMRSVRPASRTSVENIRY